MAVTDPRLPGLISRFEALPEPEQIEDDTYYSFFSSGLALLTDSEGVVRAAFLYKGGVEGFESYVGPLPHNLDMTLTQSAVRSHLGDPAFARPAGESPPLAHKGPMDRYDFGPFSMHLEYSADSGEILVVTLMTPSSVPQTRRAASKA